MSGHLEERSVVVAGAAKQGKWRRRSEVLGREGGFYYGCDKSLEGFEQVSDVL